MGGGWLLPESRSLLPSPSRKTEFALFPSCQTIPSARTSPWSFFAVRHPCLPSPALEKKNRFLVWHALSVIPGDLLSSVEEMTGWQMGWHAGKPPAAGCWRAAASGSRQLMGVGSFQPTSDAVKSWGFHLPHYGPLFRCLSQTTKGICCYRIWL